MSQYTDIPMAVRVDLSGSPYRIILRLAMPTVAAMVTQGIATEVDGILLGRLPSHVSSLAQAALVPSLILVWAFGGSLSAISVGTQALTARRFAERQYTDAGRVVVNAMLFALMAGALLTVLGYLLLPLILTALLRVPEVRGAAHDILKWRFIGITAMVISYALKAFFDGIGKTHVYLLASLVMNSLNVLLSYALIFGRWGVPAMGIAGVGVSGTIASSIGLMILLVHASRREYRAFRRLGWRTLNAGVTWNILRLSAPSAVATVAVMSGCALFVNIVSHLDALSDTTQAVNGAATTVVVIVLKLTFTTCLAFGTSTATLVSQSLGVRDAGRATQFGWASVHLGLLDFWMLWAM